jgi:A/G-specific adenine glycosylase
VTLPEPGARREPLVEQLLAWFARHQRDLPWRRDRDPYRVWVSEVMLQQTRVDTVVPYFERFVDRFPTVRALAEAELDDVLKAWEGLGYYRRARHLKAGAESIVRDGGADGRPARLPEDYAGLREVPGIGRYTAGAILSVAHGQPFAVVDGNVRRVLSRLWAVDERSTKVDAWLWDTAETLLPADHPGAFNEALMELGATVCTPRRPDCTVCPVAQHCDGLAAGDPTNYPGRVERKPIPHKDVTAGVIRRGERILITRRRADAMLGGLWEFPGGKVEPGETLEQCLHREIDEELGITIRIERPLVAVKHAYSHFRITLHTYLCRHSRGRVQDLGCDEHRWVRLEQLEDFAFPKADRVVLEVLKDL